VPIHEAGQQIAAERSRLLTNYFKVRQLVDRFPSSVKDLSLFLRAGRVRQTEVNNATLCEMTVLPAPNAAIQKANL
jgi:hypothetical protein